jgi:SSS family solute:Na+ symporter
VFIYGIFINLQNYGIDQNFIQRYMSARTEKEAVSSALGGGLLYVPVSLLFFMIGTGLFVYYQVFPENLPSQYLESGSVDSVFPSFIINELPAGVTGLLIASIFAAGMSTVSTSLNSGATVILNDFYKRFRKEDTSEKESVNVLYVASGVICLLGLIVSFSMIEVEAILEVWWNLAGIFSGGMLGLFLLGYFAKKVENVPAMTGVLIGLLVIIWMSLSPTLFIESWEIYQNPLHNYVTIVVGSLVIFLTGFLLSLIPANKKKE